MDNIDLNGHLKNITENEIYNINTTGTIINDQINYFEGNVDVVINRDINNFYISRKCDDYNLYMPFALNKITKGTYDINGLGIIDIKIETKRLEINDNYIKLNYKLIFDEDNISEFYYELNIKGSESND